MKRAISLLLCFVVIFGNFSGISFGSDENWRSAIEVARDTETHIKLKANESTWIKITVTNPFEFTVLSFELPIENVLWKEVTINYLLASDLEKGIFNKGVPMKLANDHTIQNFGWVFNAPGTYYLKFNSSTDMSIKMKSGVFHDRLDRIVELKKGDEKETISSHDVTGFNSTWFKITTTGADESVLVLCDHWLNQYVPLQYDLYAAKDFENEIYNPLLYGDVKSRGEVKLDSPGTYYLRIMDITGQMFNSTKINYPSSTPSTKENLPEPKPLMATEDYLYDSLDPGAGITFDSKGLNQISDIAGAQSVIKNEIEKLTSAQKSSVTGVDLVTLLAEEAYARSTSKRVADTSLTINGAFLDAISSSKDSGKVAIEKTLTSKNMTPARDIQSTATIIVPDKKKIVFTLDQTSKLTDVDNVRVQSSDFSVTLPLDSLKSNVDKEGLTVTVSPSESPVSITQPTQNEMCSLTMPVGMQLANGADLNEVKTYTVTFNKPLTESIKLSLPALNGDKNYQVVFNSKGEVVGGKFNPATGLMDVKIQSDGTYYVKENKKSFSDISGKSKEMQNAIKILSAKGIIGGTSTTHFSPDQPITRAQIAQLLTKTLSMYHANQNGGFKDVSKSDWYYGAVGSAKKYGVMLGIDPVTFAPKKNIPKDQIVAVAARILRIQMKYKEPSNIDAYLSKYQDKNTLSSWSLSDLALATKENLVVYRVDGKFVPNGQMTRGDAAVILYRLFSKIW